MTANHSSPVHTKTMPPVQQAILIRLLPPTKTAPSPRTVMNTCNKLFRRPLPSDQWTAAADALRRDGLMEAKGMMLTAAGRQRALELLQLSDLPPRTTWGTIQGRFLLPQSVGREQAGEAERKKLNTQDKLAALLLARAEKLPARAEANLKSALEAIVCRKLGYGQLSSLEELKEEVLNERLNPPQRLTSKQLLKYVPRIVLNTGKDGLPALRDVALAGWADARSSTHELSPQSSAAQEAAGFADAVIRAARESPTGRFGDNKVFISHVWRRLRENSPFSNLDLSAFKQKLVDASGRGQLSLSRADLVQLMPPKDVDESTTTSQNATFHFVLVDRNPS